MDDDLTPRILGEIRDEVKQTNARLDETNARLDETNVRVDHMRDDLGRRIVESEMRTATAVTDLHGTVRDIRDLLADNLSLDRRVAACQKS